MSTVSDALGATAAATAAAGRFDAVEQGQIQMTAQLAGIAQQLQTSIGRGASGSGSSGGAGGGGSGGGVGGGGGSDGARGGGNGGGAGGGVTQRHRIDPSGLEKLHADISLPQLRTWRNRWGDFCQLNQLAAYPMAEQMAAFRMVLDPAMQQIVEVALDILPTSALSPIDAEATTGDGASSGGSSKKGAQPGSKQVDHSDRSRVHMKRIVVGNVRAHRRHRPAPTIPLQLRDSTGQLLTTVKITIPGGGAEATVGDMYVLRELGLSEKDLTASTFNLVMADKSTPLLVLGEKEFLADYEGVTTSITIMFSPDVKGLLLSWYDCVDLGILHENYPRPWKRQNISTQIGAIDAAPPRSQPFVYYGPVPLMPTSEDIQRIEGDVVKEFTAGPEMIIELKDDAEPFYVNGARPIPFSDRPKVKRLLDEYEAKDLRGRAVFYNF
ncbi:hypothetical protein GHT06_011451 [Daphnia sinensis]|uniref:Uncharacterized protein n=1 Tax=Daphnia sinensis TaxID=1820382 RepID=A0AAD5LD46_9CRUS|nr:hypothetical protein GHT06_011451 [Daphnia sinensis]